MEKGAKGITISKPKLNSETALENSLAGLQKVMHGVTI